MLAESDIKQLISIFEKLAGLYTAEDNYYNVVTEWIDPEKSICPDLTDLCYMGATIAFKDNVFCIKYYPPYSNHPLDYIDARRTKEDFYHFYIRFTKIIANPYLLRIDKLRYTCGFSNSELIESKNLRVALPNELISIFLNPSS